MAHRTESAPSWPGGTGEGDEQPCFEALRTIVMHCSPLIELSSKSKASHQQTSSALSHKSRQRGCTGTYEKSDVQMVSMRHCIGSSLPVFSLLLIALFLLLILHVICGKLVSTHWAGVVLPEPRSQTRWMKNMTIVARHDLHLITNEQILPTAIALASGTSAASVMSGTSIRQASLLQLACLPFGVWHDSLQAL